MKLMIGENLKRLRKEKDFTQEQFAEVLGVSYQSVSRWENDVCYPDMELLPTLASFFDTTVDKLLGVNEKIEKEKVEAYLLRFQTAISRGDVNECIRIAREGIAEYPNNYVLLNKLMYALFIAGDNDGNISDWKENMKKYDDEITSLGERIMKYCPNQNIRLEATARLAFNHCEMGRKEIGRAIYETLPPQEFCKENQIWWGLNEDEKLPYTRKQIKEGYDSLSAGLYNLIYGRLLPDKQLICVYKKMFELDRLIYDESCTSEHFYLAQEYCGFAQVYCRLGLIDNALEQLQIAAKAAIAFDNRGEAGKIYSLLLGEQAWKRTDFETDDSRSCREIMRNKWLASSDFNVIRDTSAFKEIIEQL